MAENLVIVESPAKAKTISKFLGKNFLVKSSFGHIRDLSKKNYGIDIENNYNPIYEIDPDKKKIVTELKQDIKKAEIVWLASDEDREGEAIAWHLAEVLKLPENKIRRIVFHEITKNAIQKAIESPRTINIDLVNAQQARRILDRLVGFELSEVLWKKVKSSLSAGRVQSVAVRLIVDREREIIAFKSESSYKITANFIVIDENKKKTQLKADLVKKIQTKEEALKLLNKCINSSYVVTGIEKKPAKKSPTPPFTTSTLQQEAARKLGYSVLQTMRLAQNLYEDGKITYMRTDSVNLSEEAIDSYKAFIVKEYGSKYSKPRQYKTKAKGAQEAHEAIRPTTLEPTAGNNRDEQRLYELIYKRTIASQMTDAELERTIITINATTANENFTATGDVLLFDGFLKVYKESTDDESEEDTKGMLPKVTQNQQLNLDKIEAIEKFTHYPPRFTEASLVKKLEELGIGRPSTYAPIITTVQKRGYIVKEDRVGKERGYTTLTLKNNTVSEKTEIEITGNERAKLFPTDIAMVVNDFLVANFQKIMDLNFTANVEKEFDEIASGKIQWQGMIDKFYKNFHKTVDKTIKETERNTGERTLGTDPETGKIITARIGRFGPIVQMGEASTETKPVFASIPKTKHLETITFEEALQLLKGDSNGRKLGVHPTNGKNIYARIGRFGPMIQIGENDDKEKPKFASLLKGQNIDEITLAEALKLLELPRDLGKFEDKKITVGVGKFGPFINHDSKFISLKKTDNPLTINTERAIELINEKRDADDKKMIKEFDADFKIIKDRWGKPNIYYKKGYYKLPKDTNIENLTKQDCLKIVEEQTDSTPKTKGKNK